MAREYWYFVAGILAVSLPLLIGLAVKRFHLFDISPDKKITYKIAGKQELKLHIFDPEKKKLNKELSPALLLFHGGRWQFGTPKAMYQHCQYFAAKGIKCFSVEYRLGSVGRADVRAAVEDARSALNYVLSNASNFRIDPKRVAAGGGSSGGHLAAMLGVSVSTKRQKSFPVKNQKPAALILYNPMLDLSPCKPDHHLVKGYWEQVSPYHHVDESVPPTLILIGTEDPEIEVDTAKSYCDALHSKGSMCELALYEGQSHGFFNYENEDAKYFFMTNARVMDFLSVIWD